MLVKNTFKHFADILRILLTLHYIPNPLSCMHEGCSYISFGGKGELLKHVRSKHKYKFEETDFKCISCGSTNSGMRASTRRKRKFCTSPDGKTFFSVSQCYKCVPSKVAAECIPVKCIPVKKKNTL